MRPVWVAAPAVVDWVSGETRRYWRRRRRGVVLLVSEEVSSGERVVEFSAVDKTEDVKTEEMMILCF